MCDFIRSARLDRCRRDLLDPAFADQPISAIASRWGLPSAPHFSRLFRQAYGCSPREFRRTGRGAGGRGRRRRLRGRSRACRRHAGRSTSATRGRRPDGNPRTRPGGPANDERDARARRAERRLRPRGGRPRPDDVRGAGRGRRADRRQRRRQDDDAAGDLGAGQAHGRVRAARRRGPRRRLADGARPQGDRARAPGSRDLLRADRERALPARRAARPGRAGRARSRISRRCASSAAGGRGCCPVASSRCSRSPGRSAGARGCCCSTSSASASRR